MNFNLSLLIISIIFSCTFAVSITKGHESKHVEKCCPFEKKSRAVIYYSVDNVANYYSINGQMTDLSTVADNANWPVTKRINTMLAPGDVFCLNGNNVGAGDENSNPAAMIVSIWYRNYNGFYTWLNTNAKWSCDGVQAKLFNKNNDSTSIWYNVKGSFMSNIRPNAWWIWDKFSWSGSSTATCCVTLPCCLKSKRGHGHHQYDEECDD